MFKPSAKEDIDQLEYLLLAYPLYNLCSGMKNNYKTFSYHKMCRNIVEMCIHNMPSYNLTLCQQMACDYMSTCCGKFEFKSLYDTLTCRSVWLFGHFDAEICGLFPFNSNVSNLIGRIY